MSSSASLFVISFTMSNQATEVILIKGKYELNQDILICLSGNLEWPALVKAERFSEKEQGGGYNDLMGIRAIRV
jgi:hypothetical protein